MAILGALATTVALASVAGVSSVEAELLWPIAGPFAGLVALGWAQMGEDSLNEKGNAPYLAIFIAAGTASILLGSPVGGHWLESALFLLLAVGLVTASRGSGREFGVLVGAVLATFTAVSGVATLQERSPLAYGLMGLMLLSGSLLLRLNLVQRATPVPSAAEGTG